MVTIKLNIPINREGREPIIELRIERIKAKHCKGISFQTIGPYEMVMIAGRAAGLSPPDIDEIDFADFDNISEVISPLLGISPEIGKK